MQVATFVLAVVGIVLATLSLAWQAATFFLSGPRVRVRLKQGFRGSLGVMIAPPSAYTDDGREALGRQGYTEYVLAVEARNVGRLPTTVESWSFRFGNGAAFNNPLDPYNPPLPHRLEPHTRSTWYAPAEFVLVIPTAFSDRSDAAATIRAEVSLANGDVLLSRNRLFVRSDGAVEPRIRLVRRLPRLLRGRSRI